MSLRVHLPLPRLGTVIGGRDSCFQPEATYCWPLRLGDQIPIYSTVSSASPDLFDSCECCLAPIHPRTGEAHPGRHETERGLRRNVRDMSALWRSLTGRSSARIYKELIQLAVRREVG